MLGLAGATLAMWGCEPATITEARDQLGRGPDRTLVLIAPVTQDTLEPRMMFGTGRDTVVSGLVAAKMDAERFAIALAGLQVAPVTFEESTQIPPTALELDDLEDVIRGSTLNAAVIGLAATNSAAAPVEVSNGTIGIVELDAMGNIPRDVFGRPQYQTDAGGSPILVPVVDPGQATLTVPAAASTTVSLPAAVFADRLVHMLLDGRATAVVAEGTVSLAGGSPTDVTLSDVLDFEAIPVILLDLTVPDTGVVLQVNRLESGLAIDSTDADQIVDRLVRAAISSRVVSQVPFGVEIDIAYAPGDRGDLTDIFSLPDAVVLSRLTVDRPPVDASGRATQSVADTVSAEVTGAQVRGLLGSQFTAGLRVRLLPDVAAGSRGAVAATDLIGILASVRIEVRTGGQP